MILVVEYMCQICLMRFSPLLPKTPFLYVNYQDNKIEETSSTRFLSLNIDKKLNCPENDSANPLFKLYRLINIKKLLSAYYGIIDRLVLESK